MKRVFLPNLLTLVLILTACSAATPTEVSPTQPLDASQSKPAAVDPTEPNDQSLNNANGSSDLTRNDQQGAVIVEVTPLNLDDASEQLEFDVALETHSVDLNMDLATLATLTTDAGVTIPAMLWDAPRGGHHVSGKLIFPAQKDGKSLLDGASKLTLTILNIDAPSRVFEWQLD